MNFHRFPDSKPRLENLASAPQKFCAGRVRSLGLALTTRAPPPNKDIPCCALTRASSARAPLQHEEAIATASMCATYLIIKDIKQALDVASYILDEPGCLTDDEFLNEFNTGDDGDGDDDENADGEAAEEEEAGTVV